MTNTHTDTSVISRREIVATLCGGALAGVSGCLGATGDSGGSDSTGISFDSETFEELSALEAVGGQLSANTERNVSGTQCAAFDTGADSAWLHVPLAEPMDFSNVRPACYLAMEGDAAGRLLYLDLRDADGNRFRMRTVIRSRGELVNVDFGMVDPEVDGTAVDLENITRISFRPSPQGESGTEIIYFDHPTTVSIPETPKIVFQFDDGNETDYTVGLPTLSEHDYPAITYINTGTVGEETNLDESQLQELDDAGWLIGSHTVSHANISELSDPAEIEAEVRDAYDWLVERGYTEGARHFAYPYGGIDEQALSIVSQYHDTGRVGGYQPVGLPANPQLIPGDGDPTPEEAAQLLDWAVQYGGIVSFWFHNLTRDEHVSNFEAVVDDVRQRDRAGDLDVIGLGELESLAGGW